MKGKRINLIAAFAIACCMMLPVCAKAVGQAEEETVLSSQNIVAGVTANIQANKIGEAVDEGDYSYNLQYGTLDDVLNFSLIKPQNGLGSQEVYGNNNYTSAHINNGLIRVSEGFGLIYSLKVEQNYKITITNPKESTLNSYLYPVYLDTLVFNGEYRVDVNSIKFPLTEKNLIVEANAISHEVHLAAGDVLYFIISADTMGRSINNFLPEFRLSATGYDAQKRFDFAGYKEFRAEAASLQEVLEDYFFTFDESLYSEDNYLRLVVLIEDSIKALDDVPMGTDLAEYERNVKTNCENILTLQEEADALVALKTKRIAELDAYYKELLKNKYSLIAKRNLKKRLAEGKAALADAKNTAAVNVAFNAAKAKLLKVERGSDLWIWLTAGGVCIAGAGVTTLIVLKKKRKKPSEE